MDTQRAWIGFWLLAVIWGSSFLFIRIGVEQLSTFQLVFIRSVIAAIGLNLVVYFRGKRLPTDAAGTRVDGDLRHSRRRHRARCTFPQRDRDTRLLVGAAMVVGSIGIANSGSGKVS